MRRRDAISLGHGSLLSMRCTAAADPVALREVWSGSAVGPRARARRAPAPPPQTTARAPGDAGAKDRPGLRPKSRRGDRSEPLARLAREPLARLAREPLAKLAGRAVFPVARIVDARGAARCPPRSAAHGDAGNRLGCAAARRLRPRSEPLGPFASLRP